ncbi:MAG TPA: class I SAM-dependent methyltransferase [Vicinamibacterales bacterium]|nr:class I SAM-dependent methyltransferase [Vicinamibacterales bacterium]
MRRPGTGRVTAGFADAGPCWVCGGRDSLPFHHARFDLSAYVAQDPELAAYTGATVALRRCRACGFAQPERLPSLPRFFERMYDQHWSAEWVAAEFEAGCKDRIFHRVLTLLESRLPAGRRRLLDVGAHAGRFLRLASEAGWSVEGIEVNPRTAAFAASRTGARVHCGAAAELELPDVACDAVTLIDVLEHVPGPLSLLTRVRRLLRPDGWVAVKVPSGPAQLVKERLRAATSRRYSPRLADNLVHVNHFSPRSLRTALERAGFDSVHLEVALPELPGGHRWSSAVRLAAYWTARTLPLGSPLAFNLQACARRPREEGAL